jgi:hypothetical protein
VETATIARVDREAAAPGATANVVRAVKVPATQVPVGTADKVEKAAIAVPVPRDGGTARPEEAVAATTAEVRAIPGSAAPNHLSNPYLRVGSSISFPKNRPLKESPSRSVPVPRLIRSSSLPASSSNSRTAIA